MDVTALCIRLLIIVLMVVVAQVHAQNDGAAVLRIVPDRLQFFEYESISINCEFNGLTGGKVMRSLKEIKQIYTPNWVTSAGSGTIEPAFAADSGEYWCEDGDGQRSRAVNISVTDGSVILESPVHPVKEGDNVTLYCKKKNSSSDSIADFYKDGLHIGINYKGILTIINVSTSDEGLYKCIISGAGESPESRLTVRAVREYYNETFQNETSQNETSQNEYPLLSPPAEVLRWIAVSGSCMALLLLSVVGLFYCCKHKHAEDTTAGGTKRGEEGVVNSDNAPYAVVRKQRKERSDDGVVGPEEVTYDNVTIKEREPNVSRANTQPYLSEENAVYSLLSHGSTRAETPY